MARPTKLIYKNDKYGFILRFPSWWRRYCVISKRRKDPDSEYELHFRFKYKGKIYDDIFAILVYRMSKEEWVRRGYKDSPLTYLGAYDGRVFAALTPEELPYAFVDPKTGDYDYRKYGTAIGLLKRMVNRDVPALVKTISFPRKQMTLESMPLRSRQICGCRLTRRTRKRKT
ncbi:hypothetical protein SAMN02799630_05088 [Paenibacillus sp. UNCCL117]|uniref:hypothetical protein n=1 Tax=unclassified Paenibacillus TaxID=185978 RepID=UPI00088C30B8|nr:MULTISPECIES: hypothetical protein [unclassified Paenibacillus]SDE30355.1 hypothetical protein SAMN04488602_12470 [Paenibacillus sp. cl123]SFW63098.1 hypothetical protein SAMN02799630_05088 [Paenibacillus sp. UNCCL117]